MERKDRLRICSTTGEIPREFYEPIQEDATVDVLKNRIIVLDPGHGGSDRERLPGMSRRRI